VRYEIDLFAYLLPNDDRRAKLRKCAAIDPCLDENNTRLSLPLMMREVMSRQAVDLSEPVFRIEADFRVVVRQSTGKIDNTRSG
jgi:hypothetical protein